MNYQEKTLLLKNGKTCLLRCPQESDAEMLIEYLKATAAETRFFQREPEEHTETVAEETVFIRAVNEAERDLLLLAFVDGQFAGSCGMDSHGNKQRTHHRCDIGISLHVQ